MILESSYKTTRDKLTRNLILSAMMDCLVNPLQDRLEDWKKATVNLDKEHSKGMFL